MIRKLIFAAALLAPGVASAANPSASFTDEVVQAGSHPIACDIGPPYTGQIPAGAVRAGYTHCAVNLDMTQFTNANQVIDCLGASTPLLFFNSTDPNQSPCDGSHYAIVSDGGSNSLQISYLSSDYRSDGRNQLWSFVKAFSAPGQPYTGWTFPEGYYVENVFRVPSQPTYTVSSGSANAQVYGPFLYTPEGSSDWFEVDFDETWNNGNFNSNGPYADLCGGGCVQYPSPSCCAVPSPLPNFFTQYITEGTRLTANGSSAASACFYSENGIVNGSQNSAAQFSCLTNTGISSSNGLWTSRVSLYFSTAIPPSTATGMSGNNVALMKRMTIWSCPGWRDNNSSLGQGLLANECYPGVLTGTP
jgi:hypothetical protein